MTPMLLEGPDVLVLLAIVVLLFGGAKLAGLGKSAGRALREFKEETRGLSQSGPDTETDHAVTSEPQAQRPAVDPGPRRVHDVGLTRPSASPAAGGSSSSNGTPSSGAAPTATSPAPAHPRSLHHTQG